MPIQGLQFTILNGQEAHQSYQVTTSFVVYNPNDGVAYIATDRTANGLTWDYKVPSQSGGKFPGPINSYLSIFYLDQSGSGGGGQVVVYASLEAVAVPYFWSIGRALQGQVTSMDVVIGSQPGNPAAGIARLWVDSAGHLHILQSTGTDYQVLDTSNYGSLITLAGDVSGPVNNNVAARASGNFNVVGILRTGPSVGGAAAGDISAVRTSNTATGVIYLGQNGAYLFFDGSNYQMPIGGLYVTGDLHARWAYVSDGSNGVVQSGNGALYLRSASGAYIMDSGGVLTVTGPIQGSSYLYAAAYMASPTWYLDTSAGSYYLNRSGAVLQAANLNILSWGWIGLSANSAINLSWDGARIVASQNFMVAGAAFYLGNNTGYYVNASAPWMQIAPNTNCIGQTAHNGQTATSGSYDNLAHGNGFLAPNNNPGGVGLGQSWGTYSSVEHAQQYGLPITPINDPMGKVKNITGVYYEHMNFDPVDPLKPGVQPRKKADGSYDTRLLYGFSAKDVHAILPELVTLGPDGEPESIDLDRMLVVLWEAVKELDARITTTPV